MKTINSSILSGHPRGGDPRRDPWKIIFRMKSRLRVYLCVKNQASRPGKRHFRIKFQLKGCLSREILKMNREFSLMNSSYENDRFEHFFWPS